MTISLCTISWEDLNPPLNYFNTLVKLVDLTEGCWAPKFHYGDCCVRLSQADVIASWFPSSCLKLGIESRLLEQFIQEPIVSAHCFTGSRPWHMAQNFKERYLAVMNFSVPYLFLSKLIFLLFLQTNVFFYIIHLLHIMYIIDHHVFVRGHLETLLSPACPTYTPKNNLIMPVISGS